MRQDDVALCLSAMRAMWPAHTPTDDELRLWTMHLGGMTVDDVLPVLGLLERSSKWWPHWSEFLEVYEPMVRRRLDTEHARRALNPGKDRPCTAEETSEWIKRCRGILANAKGPLARGLGKVIR